MDVEAVILLVGVDHRPFLGVAERHPLIDAVFVDGALWTFSTSGIRVSDQHSLAQQTWISFG